ncbi:DUF6020 family protein [Halobacillus litoralis]|uniref:Glycosyltransferase RgtA/B/C/D-like domain-containing protein n=1 Tax=Halobacillus litoralis TaxID=45668 RepID=A0A410MFB4_9BACI|nr:DUF6020 family protein [Halobacillus litoralis]QAS53355.1 hypothetical protein HLI_14720 [Halobacillus litoralis]
MNRTMIFLLSSLGFSLWSTVALISLYQSISETSPIIITFTFVFFFVVGLFMLFSINKNQADFTRFIKRKSISSFSAVFSFVLLISLRDSSTPIIEPPFLFGLFTLAGSFLVLFLCVSWLIFFLSNMSAAGGEHEVSKWKVLVYAIPPILGWLIYLIAYYPGTMTPDSLLHWEQIHTYDFSNWHPVVYTWYIMLLTSIWKTPAIVALSQIVILALFGGYGAYRLEKSGLSTTWVWIGVLLFSAYPLNGIFPIAIWKDIFFSGFIFLFTILIYNIVSTNGRWLHSPWHLMILAINALAIALMRSNGLPIFAVMAVLLLIVYRAYLLRLFVTVLFVVTCYFLITGPLFNYMEVRGTDPNEALSIPTQQFAHIISEDGDLTQEQRAYLDDIFPLELWEENYDPYITNPIKFSGKYDKDVIFDDFGYYLKTWASVVSNNFGLAVEAYLDQTSIIWQINQPEDGYTSTYARNVYLYNDYDLKTDPLHSGVYKVVNSYLEKIKTYLLEPLLRPAFYTAIILLAGTVLTIRNGAKALLIILPVLLNTGTMLLATPAQDFRYQFANVLVAFIMVGVMFIKFDSNKKKVQHE